MTNRLIQFQCRKCKIMMCICCLLFPFDQFCAFANFFLKYMYIWYMNSFKL